MADYVSASEHFSQDELKCSHTGVAQMRSDFMEILEKVRSLYGKPMNISSAYRDKTHPVEAKKGDRAGKGDHCRGVAVDVLVAGSEAVELMRIAIDCGIDRLGISQKGSWGSRFIHLGLSDPDAGKPPAIWSY